MEVTSQPGNVERGLIGMGQALLLPQSAENHSIVSTTGCGPCLGVALIYRGNEGARMLFAHLQPEVDITAYAESVRATFSDDVCAKVELHIATVMCAAMEDAERQRASIEGLVAGLAEKYDYVVLDDSNVFRYDSQSLSVNMGTLDVSTADVTATFSGADLDYMEAHMAQDATSLHYFR